MIDGYRCSSFGVRDFRSLCHVGSARYGCKALDGYKHFGLDFNNKGNEGALQQLSAAIKEGIVTFVTGNVVYIIKSETDKTQKRKAVNECLAALDHHSALDTDLNKSVLDQVKKARSM